MIMSMAVSRKMVMPWHFIDVNMMSVRRDFWGRGERSRYRNYRWRRRRRYMDSEGKEMEARMEALVTIRLAEISMQVREEVTEDLQ